MGDSDSDVEAAYVDTDLDVARRGEPARRWKGDVKSSKGPGHEGGSGCVGAGRNRTSMVGKVRRRKKSLSMGDLLDWQKATGCL
jgi:hypothetical protein